MTKKTKTPEMPKLPKQFAANLMQIAESLNGRPINLDYASEWKISYANATLLLEYLYKTGILEIMWLPEQQQMCFIRKIYTLN